MGAEVSKLKIYLSILVIIFILLYGSHQNSCKQYQYKLKRSNLHEQTALIFNSSGVVRPLLSFQYVGAFSPFGAFAAPLISSSSRTLEMF